MKISALRAVVVLAFAAACNGGGSTDFVAPSVALTFPPLVSSTDQASITVTGTAFDPSGVAQVSVNGVLASTSDGFASWHASVPLVLGMNVLTVAAVDLHGNSDGAAAAARIESQALLLAPAGIAVEAFAQVAYVACEGREIQAVDLVSGARTTVSGDSRGTGPGLHDAFRIALDLVGRQALVIHHGSPGWVITVDLATGNRAILSDDTHGTGPTLGGPLAIAVDGDRALVTSGGMIPAQVMAVDLTSGDRTILSNAAVGSGPALKGPDCIAVDGNRALVVDSNRILAVDLSTGDRTILSDGSSLGPDLIFPMGVAVDQHGRALVVDRGLQAVVAVDLVSGIRTTLSDGFQGGGPGLVFPTAIALDGRQALVPESSIGALLGVDLVSGERSVVSAPTSVGAGPSFTTGAIALDGHRALIAGAGMSSLLALDLATGDRTIVSDAFTGNGPHFQDVHALAVDGGRALVAGHALFAVDLASGDRSIVSDSSRGAGPMFEDPVDIAVFGNQAIVVDEGWPLIVVDLASGDRRSLEGLPFHVNSPSGIVVDGNRAVVLTEFDDGSSAVVAVDLASEEASIVSLVETRGEGPNLREDAEDLALDGDRVLVIDGASIIAVDLATGDRTLLTDHGTGTGPVRGFRRVERTRDGLLLTDWYLQAVLSLELQFGQRTILAR